MIGEIIAWGQNYFHIFIAFASRLDSGQITILVIITALLVLFLAYRFGGFGAVGALLIIYLIVYVLYINNIFNIYKQKQATDYRDKKILEDELRK